jgi:opacity protein-like surface antigen
MLVGSGDDVCKLSQDQSAAPINTAGYYCIDPGNNNADYPDRNDKQGTQNKNIVQDGKTDKVAGGGAFGNVRLLLTFDFALSPNFLLGLHGGVILNSYPGTAAQNDGKFSALGPVHLEGRATYVIGRDGVMRPGVGAYLMGGFGYAQSTARVGVSVREQGSPQNKQVDAWAIGGPIFFTVGGGLRYGLSSRAALLIGPRLNFAFGNGLGFFPSTGLEGGIQFGL